MIFFVNCHCFVIKSTDRVKYLGVTIDKFLKCELIVEMSLTRSTPDSIHVQEWQLAQH